MEEMSIKTNSSGNNVQAVRKKNTGRYFLSFLTSGILLDGISSGSAIYYLIIHHVFTGEKKRHPDVGASANLEKRHLED